MMVGAAIGGGEWLMGPAVTAKYGGIVMWIAAVSIFFQVIYNLEIQRYTVYCGEPIVVGFFRIAPGPRFWTFAYLAVDFFGIWPYLAMNAAVPLTAAVLGHLPGEMPTKYLSVEEVSTQLALPLETARELHEHPERFGSGEGRKPLPEAIQVRFDAERKLRERWGIAVFLLCFIPLLFGGKIYNTLEKMMVLKILLVLGYLLFLGIFYVSARTWIEVFAGFAFLGKDAAGTWSFGFFPGGQSPDWSLLAAFAAIAGQGGMTNSQVSTYVRDKGWGMGGQVGAMPSLIGGTGISLSHTGKIFPVTAESIQRWKGWIRFLWRDQWVIWFIGCLLGVAIPALVSLEFVRGAQLEGDAVAAATARAITGRTGIAAFWFLTLICGFIVLVPSQISQVDGVIRRWTDLLWTGLPQFKHWHGNAVKVIYYTLLAGYAAWGLVVLLFLTSSPILLTKVTGCIMNFALGFSAFHTLAVNLILLPQEVRPSWPARIGLVGCGLFFLWISGQGTYKVVTDLIGS
jgi:hypothetical protein